MTRSLYLPALAAGLLGLAVPAGAQEAGAPVPTVEGPPPAAVERLTSPYDGDYLTIGAGAVLSPSYTGSDDYVVSPIPVLFASYGGVQFSPRGAGMSIDFVPDSDEGLDLTLGVAGRLRSDRAVQIRDDVVESLGKLDRAVELGPVVGVGVSGALNPYDSLSADVTMGWDVAGAHRGWVIEPSVRYFTPLSRAMIASLSISAEYAQGKVMDYYYRVTPAQSAATGGVLPAFEPDGGGFTKLGGSLLLGYDLNGDLTDGGLGLVGILGYSRVLGDAKRSPFTSVRGSADQFILGLGIGYTF